MATYVNDLRLKEIGTGESSGTWGSETNTNLELIAEAFSFGTEAITTNADTHTTTIADGSTDPGRSLYLKYTGTLDSACTITIGPNTVSKMWFIENATSGSQNIIIKQGSGATITIPPGDVKVVYSDGAGSGAAVVDAFASLSVVDLKVQDDLTVTDDLIVNGDIDLEGNMDVNGSLETDALSLNGTTVTSTAAELNILDGVTSTAAEINLLDGSSANTVVNSKAVIYGSSGQVAGTLSTAAQPNITSLGTLTALTGGTGDLNWDSGTLFVDSSANAVGIGTTSPSDLLDVRGDGADTYIRVGSDTAAGNDSARIGKIDSSTDFIIQASLGSTSSNTIFKRNTSQEAMRINASGNVGINENSPSATLHTNSGTGNIGIHQESTDSGSYISFSDNSTTSISHVLLGAVANDLVFNAGDAERMRINSTGVVSIGNTENTGFSDDYLVQVGTDGSGSNSFGMLIRANQSGTSKLGFADGADADGTGKVWYDHSSNYMRFDTAGSERLRIDSSGHVLLGTTSNQGVGGISFEKGGSGFTTHNNNNAASGGYEFYVFRRSSTQIGSIAQNGTTGIQLNTSSDARLKEVTGSARGLDVINNLNPVAYNWKADNRADEGLIAQEVEEFMPNAVSQTEDGYYMMDYSKLVTPLIKAVQEQQEQIESLKSEIENLKEK